MIEVGIKNRIWSRVKKLTKVINSNSFISVDFQVLLFPFGILIFGILFAYFILILEIIIYRHFKKKIMFTP